MSYNLELLGNRATDRPSSLLSPGTDKLLILLPLPAAPDGYPSAVPKWTPTVQHHHVAFSLDDHMILAAVCINSSTLALTGFKRFVS